MDSNNDGIGDFKGVIERLDYLKSLGVTAIWCLPFYPSPLRDDGFDVADYRGVNPSYGTLEDFRSFISLAHSKGLKVITELVVNHTSDQHPWFQRARKAPKGSVERDFYVWSDDPEKYNETRIIFCDTEKSNWTWDEEAGAYYWHRFYSHQPDLNFDNPQVFREVTQIMAHWLDMGVDGMRLDAIPYLVEREGTINENLPETHKVVKKLRAWMDERYQDRMFLAEANQWPEEVVEYFGEGDECNVCYHFPVMPRLYMALAKEDAQPIVDIMEQTPAIPEGCQWAMFLRNHDELTLEMVTESERQFMWNHYAPDTRARINMGIRRRLAPLMGGDRRKIELMNSFLMSLPGAPIVYYGDEIGMGDNIYLNDRDGVRTPMQWSPDRNGGFSKVDPAKLFLPAIMDPLYGYNAVNVEAQECCQSSLLNWTRRIIKIRSEHPVFSRGKIRFLPSGNRRVISYLREGEGETILCVANLSGQPQHVELDLAEFEGNVPVELVGSCCFPSIGEFTYQVTMPEYGFFWFLLVNEEKAAKIAEKKDDYPIARPTLVLPDSWKSLADSKLSSENFARIMEDFLPEKRWYGAKGSKIKSISLVDQVEVKETGGQLYAVLKVELEGGEVQSYFLPMAIDWEAETDARFKKPLSSIFSRVRRREKVGTLYDGIISDKFATRMIEQMGKNLSVARGKGAKITFSCNDLGKKAIAQLGKDATEKLIGTEQSNSSVIVGSDMILKVYRRVAEGKHPEVATCKYLTEVAGFKNSPAYLGVVESISADGKPTALAILQSFVKNQGDGWNNTLGYLERFFEDVENISFSQAEKDTGRHSIFLSSIKTLGKRTAEMHKAFAIGGDKAFDPEPVTDADINIWVDSIRKQAAKTKAEIEKHRGGLPKDVKKKADMLLSNWKLIENRIEELKPKKLGIYKTRYHGDYHLGQVVVAQGDFYILDFEGEPLRPLNDRQIKGAQMKDVAGMVRSFNYAAWGTLFNRMEAKKQPLERLIPWVEDWEKRTVDAFLSGYQEEIAGCLGYPDKEVHAKKLLDLFVIEKALYEVVYEVANRPTWLPIPVMGVSRLIGLDEEK